MTERKVKHPVLLTLFILIAIIVGSVLITESAIKHPIKYNSDTAITIAKKNTDLKQIDRVTRFVYDKVEYTISGVNSKGTYVFVVISDKGKRVTVYRQDAGVDERKVINQVQKEPSLKKITSSRFGIIKNKPVWMVSYLNRKDNLVIKTFNFKNGQLLKTVSTY